MWHIATYQSTALFSLRPANATASGGKTLITPTPFAVKMALLDVAIRVHGRKAGEAWFPRFRDLEVAVKLPEHLTVIKTFVKILRPHKNGARDTFGTGLEGPMGNTIAYRELVHYGGAIGIAVHDIGQKGEPPPLPSLLAQIHYLGKRGGFMQVVDFAAVDDIEPGFTRLDQAVSSAFSIGGMLQLLDDCGPKMTFAHADIYSGKRIGIGKPDGRLLRSVVLPYRVIRSGRTFDLYALQTH